MAIRKCLDHDCHTHRWDDPDCTHTGCTVNIDPDHVYPPVFSDPDEWDEWHHEHDT